jgi:hypothetical protein
MVANRPTHAGGNPSPASRNKIAKASGGTMKANKPLAPKGNKKMTPKPIRTVPNKPKPGTMYMLRKGK